MPWIDGNFSAVADAAGVVNYARRISSPFPLRLERYRVHTTSGCSGRSHVVQMRIARADDPADKLEVGANIEDCSEYNNKIQPPYSIRTGKNYDLALTVSGFNANEPVEGVAGVLYSLFFMLTSETA